MEVYFPLQVFLVFSGNSAIVASSVYVNNLGLCSWVQEVTPLFQPNRAFRWNFVQFRLVTAILSGLSLRELFRNVCTHRISMVSECTESYVTARNLSM